MKEYNIRSHTVIAEISCLILSLVLIFSGFTKAVDPYGGALKITEYFLSFGFKVSHNSFVFILFLSVFESTFEFVLGVHLILGIRKKLVSLLTLFLIAAMTLLTLYIFISGKVSDCGCFGDAIHLSNKETFLKNLVLLFLAVIVFTKSGKIITLLSHNIQWIAQLYSLFFILAICIWSYLFLPIIDFRPYYIGQNISVAVSLPPGAKAPQYKTTFILEKNGIKKEFSLDNYPDSSWRFVNSRTEEISKGDLPEISDFAVFSANDEEVSYSLINNKKYAFWLIIPKTETMDHGVVDVIEDLYEYCRKEGYDFLGITSSSKDSSEDLLRSMGIKFPFFFADEVMLKTMIRSNPGLMLVKDGKILNKWSKYSMPEAKDLNSDLRKLPLSYGNKSHGLVPVIKWLISFFIPLIILIFADRIYRMRKSNI